MRSVLRGQERSGQKQYFFYPSAGSAQQQAAERCKQWVTKHITYKDII